MFFVSSSLTHSIMKVPGGILRVFQVPIKGVHFLKSYEIYMNDIIRGRLLTFPVCDFTCPSFHFKMRCTNENMYLGNI